MYDEKRVMLSNVIVNQIAWFPYARERERERQRERKRKYLLYTKDITYKIRNHTFLILVYNHPTSYHIALRSKCSYSY